MEKQHFTIGMAGHIDHGKTTLTKALTNIDTDRLKEEKERQISIELGYAPLDLGDDMEVSIIDVPGHEKFIRQMIAGVAGIDMVVLVVAADEGVMPQTKEHVEILGFLGIQHAVVALTKASRVEEELIELVIDDVKEELAGTIFAEADMIIVDSVEGVGIEELKAKIKSELKKTDIRDVRGSFRLPIDQVFTVQGQGTVVRGTVYEGFVEKNQQLIIMPEEIKVKARQIQVHHKEVERAVAGQRAAINLGGVSKSELKRGDVLVSSNHFVVTGAIDVSMQVVKDMVSPLKQRGPVKLHVGTAEVMGKLVFFDRNELTSDDSGEIFCQIRLEEPIVTKRGDRFIVRRPSPVETIGGGWVIDPQGDRYRFGQQTIKLLKQKKEGTPFERVKFILIDQKYMTKQELIVHTSLHEEALDSALQVGKENGQIIPIKPNHFTLRVIVDEIVEVFSDQLNEYHEQYPMRLGINKAELIQSLSNQYPKRLLEYVIELKVNDGNLSRNGQFISMDNFIPQYPKQWKTRMENVISTWKKDELMVKPWSDYTSSEKIPAFEEQELKNFLLLTEEAFTLDEKMMVSKEAVYHAAKSLYEVTDKEFTLQDAKEKFGLSRKYLVPLLELFDQTGLTVRVGEKRRWVQQKVEQKLG